MVAEARRQELARLQSMIEQRMNVVITGGRGMGKTALVEELIHRSDAVIVRVPCSRADSDIPMSGARGAIAALTALGDPDFVNALTEIEQSGIPPAKAAEAAINVVLTTSFPGPVLAVFDGFDVLDADSQELFGHMMRRMANTQLRAVATARHVGEDGSLAGIPTIELPPLDRETMISLARRMVEGGISEDAAATAAHNSGGSPLVLRNVLSQMTDRQRRGETPFPHPVCISDGVERAVLADIADLSPEMRELLRIISLSPLTPIEMLQRRYAEFWEEVLELKAHNVIEQHGPFIVLRDSLLGSAVHWSMTAAQRCALRREIIADEVMERSLAAEAVVGSPTLGGAVVRWQRSFAEFEGDVAGALLRDARLLVESGRASAGISFAERALTLTVDRSGLASGLLKLATTLLFHGDGVFAERYLRFAAGTQETRLQLGALSVRIQAEFYRHGTLPAGVRRLWGSTEAREEPEAVARLQLVVTLAHAERYELSEAETLLAEASSLLRGLEAAGRAPAADVLALEEAARVMLDGYRGRDDRALAVARRLRGTRALDLSGFTALVVARALTLTEHYAEAREVFELMERRLDENLLWHPHIPLLRADLEIRAGNLHLVPDFIDTGSRRRRPGMPFREDLHLLFEVWRFDEAGRDEEAKGAEHDLVRRASAAGDRGALAHLSAFQGAHLLARGRPAEAVRHLQRCDELAPGDIDPAVIRHEPELIEALVGVGRREHAMLVLQRFRLRLNRFPSRWGEIALQRCEALLADGEASLDLFRRMLRGWKTEDSDRERARVLAAFAQRLQDLGRPAEAADARAQARIHCERAGDRVRARALDDVPVAPAAAPRPAHPVLSQLTEEERMVIDLVREGLRNREIADRIYVSLRTVEIRLTRIYRRFGVRSRTELIAKLSGTAEAVAG